METSKLTAADFTTAETTLRDLLATQAAHRAGSLARAHGWPAPNIDQLAEMTRALVSALSELVRGMRDPRAGVPSPEEIGELIEGLALGALEKVLGPPQPDVLH